MTRNEFAYKAHKNAKKKGFWKERLSYEHCLMLVITDIAEAIEADRKDRRAFLVQFEAGAFIVGYHDGSSTKRRPMLLKSNVEVIGNIHQNLDLLQ